MTTEVKIGKTIQNFRLKDQRREEMHLYDLKRKSFCPSTCLPGRRSAHNRWNHLKKIMSSLPNWTQYPWYKCGLHAFKKNLGKGWGLRTSGSFRISGRMGRLPEHTGYSKKKKESLKGRISLLTKIRK